MSALRIIYPKAIDQFLEECSHTWKHGSRLVNLLIEHYPGSNAAPDSADRILELLVEEGDLRHGARAHFTPSQSAFIGLQFTMKAAHEAGFAGGFRTSFDFQRIKKG